MSMEDTEKFSILSGVDEEGSNTTNLKDDARGQMFLPPFLCFKDLDWGCPILDM